MEKYNYDITRVVPEHIRYSNPELMEFMDAYYHWLNEEGKPGALLNNLPKYRDVDTVADAFLEYLQREIAVSIPESIRANKRKIYKNVTDIYLSRGSIPSYQAVFRLIFDDDIELFFPRVDILKPSDGKWDAVGQRWTNDDGKLSVKKFIQDSRYYQSFSYVIKTGQTIENWRDAVKKLLHPAGFAFFGQVVVFTEATTGFSRDKTSVKMPLIQPGRAETGDFPLPVISGPINVPMTVGFLRVDFIIVSKAANPVGPTLSHLEHHKFVIDDTISIYSHLSTENVIAGLKTNIVPGAIINEVFDPLLRFSYTGIGFDSDQYTMDSVDLY